ncbi:MAG TPA: PKD domain-containing protein, partial [Bacteroidales bacterium]|nr:PKD domain-containing protein [Bacteroidales bacterium]
MKRLIILFCVFMIYAAATAQSIVQAEYFVNDDPGFGNGIPIPVSFGMDVMLNFNVNTNGLENGLHALFIRAKDDNGAWSAVAHRPFLIGNYPADPLLPLVRAEYFIDDDPGQGLGTPIPFDPNDGLTEKLFVVILHGVEVGTHTLYIRTLDENGHWSLTYAEPFEVEMPLIVTEFSANITEGSIPLPVQFTDETYISEPHTWFWDFGDGNTSTLQNPQHTYVDPGKYTVSLTATSDAGSDTETKVDYITVYPPLYTLEYFFNDDPGYGNGNKVYDYSSLAGGFDFNVPVDELEGGLNILFFRAIDTLGRWSQTSSRTLIKAKLINELWPNIMAAEYFYDDDPGYGFGIQLTVTPGITGEIEAVIPLEDVAHGWHMLYFRTKDENGQWSQTISRPFLKLFIPDDPVTITHLEYFINDDPGVGNGNPVIITPGNMVEQSFIIYPGSLPPGEYTLYVRSRDDRGSWSIVFNQAFEVEPSTGCPPPNTLTAINITTNAATLGWNPCGTEIEWEVLWGLNGFDPETEGVLIQNLLDYSYLLEGLSSATSYDFYVRAVCTDEVSDWAGPASFTTQEEQIIELPTVQTAAVGEITQTTAQSGGTITDDGGAPVTARGVVWSTTENPTLEINEGITYDGAGTGSWVSELAELTLATDYFVRAYATNSIGTAYGEELLFTTLNEPITEINFIRGGPASTNPLAIPIQISGVNANPFRTDLNQWTGNWEAPQAIYDQGTYVNNPDFWSNIGGNTAAGSTWFNSSPGN